MITTSNPFSIFDGQSATCYQVTRESAELLADLQLQHVRFAHWKGNNHLLLSLEGKTDIEMLVHPGDRLQFETILRKRCYKKLNSRPWNSYPAVEDWIGFDFDTGNLLHLHTHYDLVTGITYGKYLHLPWQEQFFRHLKIDRLTGWPIPSSEMEALVLLIRIHANMVHKNTVIPEVKQKELQELLSQTQAQHFRDLCHELELNVPANLDTEISRIAKDYSEPSMIRLSSFFYNQLSGCVKAKKPMGTLKTYYYKNFLKAIRYAGRFNGPVQLKKTIADGGGKIIALVGSDGAGKSTLCNDLVKWLTFKIDTHYFYLGKRPFIKSYDQHLFSKTGFLFNNPVLSKYFRKLAGGFYHILLINKKIKMLRLAKRLTKKGSLVICDRFPQKDIMGLMDGPNLQLKKSWFSRLEMKLFRKPHKTQADLVIRLNISPVIAAQRKPAYDYKSIEQKCMSLSRISFASAKVVDMDAGRPYEQVLLDIKRKIWENL